MPLLETLVAFVIAALSLGVLIRASGDGLQATRVAAHYEEALSHARSHLDLASAALRPGERDGDDGGGFAWHTLVVQEAGSGGPALYSIRVSVSWTMDGGRREVALVTQRLGDGRPAGL